MENKIEEKFHDIEFELSLIRNIIGSENVTGLNNRIKELKGLLKLEVSDINIAEFDVVWQKPPNLNKLNEKELHMNQSVEAWMKQWTDLGIPKDVVDDLPHFGNVINMQQLQEILDKNKSDAEK